MLYPANFFSVLLASSPNTPMPSTYGENALLLADELLSILPSARAEMIRMYYRDGLTLRKIGNVYNFTPEHVRQIHAASLRKIHVHLVSVFGSWPPEEPLTYESYVGACYKAEHLASDSPLSALTRLGLAPGILSRLRMAGVQTVGDFISMDESALMSIDGFGKVTVKKLKELQGEAQQRIGVGARK